MPTADKRPCPLPLGKQPVQFLGVAADHRGPDVLRDPFEIVFIVQLTAMSISFYVAYPSLNGRFPITRRTA
jgi:hypothetical protein